MISISIGFFTYIIGDAIRFDLSIRYHSRCLPGTAVTATFKRMVIYRAYHEILTNACQSATA